MDKKLLIRPFTIVGSTFGKDAFSRVFVYQPDDDTVAATHGELYVVLSAKVPEVDENWEKIAVDSFEQLRTAYFDGAGGVLRTLEEAVQKAEEFFTKQVEGKQQDEAVITELNVGALAVWGGSFMYASGGKVYFSLARNGELINLTDDRFVHESIQDGDAFILGTQVFGKRIDTAMVQHILESELGEDWQKILHDEVKHVEEDALLTGIVLSISVEKLPDEEDVIEMRMSSDKQEEEKLKKQQSAGISVAAMLEGTRQQVGNILQKITQLRKGQSEEVYVETESTPRFSKKWIVVVGLLLLLFASIFITYRLNNRRENTALQEEQTAEVLAGLDRVEQLAEADPAQAERAFVLIDEEIGDVQGASDSVKQKYSEVYNTLYNVVTPAWSGYDIALSSKTKVSPIHDGTIVAVDGESGGIYILRGDGSSEQISQVNEFIGITYTIPNPDGVYGYHPETGLWFYSFASKSVELIITESGQWGTVRNLDYYETNVYVLAPQVEDFVKYLGLGGGALSGGTSYFVDPVDYSSIIDTAIDGHVYTLNQSGQVEKFLGGRRVEFTLHGVSPEGGTAKMISTGVGYTRIYLTTGSDVLIFDTEGLYEYSVAGPGTQIVEQAIGVSENFIVIVTENGVFRTSL